MRRTRRDDERGGLQQPREHHRIVRLLGKLVLASDGEAEDRFADYGGVLPDLGRGVEPTSLSRRRASPVWVIRRRSVLRTIEGEEVPRMKGKKSKARFARASGARSGRTPRGRAPASSEATATHASGMRRGSARLRRRVPVGEVLRDVRRRAPGVLALRLPAPRAPQRRKAVRVVSVERAVMSTSRALGGPCAHQGGSASSSSTLETSFQSQ
jgi:hypothetical protein